MSGLLVFNFSYFKRIVDGWNSLPREVRSRCNLSFNLILICDFSIYFDLVLVCLVCGLWLFCVPPTAFSLFTFSFYCYYRYSFCREL